MGTRIRKFRQQRRMTLEELADRAGMSVSNMSRLERGLIPYTQDTLESTAAALGCSPRDLLDDGAPRDPIRAPLISWVHAGAFSDMPPPEIFNAAETIVTAYDRPTVFALRVEGDSMNKTAPEGSVIVVDYERRGLLNLRPYVFRRGGQATFKLYREDGAERWIEPNSTNLRHAPIFPEPGEVFEPIGAVVDIILPRDH